MDTFDYILEVLIMLMTISMAICFNRLVIGPNVPNRTVSFDAIAVHAVGILALYAIIDRSSTLLAVAFITAVLGFLGTTMMARYLERAEVEGWQNEKSESPLKRVTRQGE